MKKFFLLAAMVSVALTGCMKNEVYVPKCDTPISFEVANYVAQTRASGVFSTTETFGVNAWSRDAAASSSVQMMTNQEVSYTDGKWKTATTYYWPINGTVDFIAYYPTSVVPTIVYDYNGADTYTYTNYTVETVADGKDLMYADKAIRFSANNTATDNDTELGYDEPLLGDYGFEGVPTLFRHALAKVNFKVQNGLPTDGVYSYDIKVNKITLKVYNQGSVTLKNEGTTAASRGTWKLPTGNVWTPTDPDATLATLTWADTSLTLSDGTAVDYDPRTQYVLPQTLVAGKQTIAVDYTVTQYQTINIGGTPTKTKISEQNYTPAAFDLEGLTLDSWQMNKNITYTITLSSIGTQILFAPAVEEWVDADDSLLIN